MNNSIFNGTMADMTYLQIEDLINQEAVVYSPSLCLLYRKNYLISIERRQKNEKIAHVNTTWAIFSYVRNSKRQGYLLAYKNFYALVLSYMLHSK